jgi:hypothetical protein
MVTSHCGDAPRAPLVMHRMGVIAKSGAWVSGISYRRASLGRQHRLAEGIKRCIQPTLDGVKIHPFRLEPSR